MKKEEFNALTIEEQVEYINTQLALVSLNRIATTIGISESTIRDRFKSKGYKRQGKSFIKLGTIEPTKENIEPKTPNKATTTTINTKAQEQTQSNKDMKVLEKKVESLEKELKSIKDILNTITTSATNTVNTNNTKVIKKYEGDGVARSYRVNEEIQKQWKVFCKSHSEHRVSDLISNALEEYMNSFK
ncbi:MAG: hypothetical protein H9W81_14965 [Enterococcus sp.]|nr:hypothetical protein [Enterococcus sp.]